MNNPYLKGLTSSNQINWNQLNRKLRFLIIVNAIQVVMFILVLILSIGSSNLDAGGVPLLIVIILGILFFELGMIKGILGLHDGRKNLIIFFTFVGIIGLIFGSINGGWNLVNLIFSIWILNVLLFDDDTLIRYKSAGLLRNADSPNDDYDPQEFKLQRRRNY